jgi:hypothetical protein
MKLTQIAAAAALCWLHGAASVGQSATSLDWITGHWRSERGGEISEEIWTTGEGGVYFAVNRTISGGKVAAFEYLRLETAGGLAYLAQPQGMAPTRFEAVEQSERRILFANPEHDYPKFVEYVREGDVLTARIWSDDTGKDAMSFEWTLTLHDEP